MQDLHVGSHAAANRRTSGAPAARDSQQQLANGSEPAATDEVSWALNDAAIPDTTVFQPLQHAQQQLDAVTMQQQHAGPTESGHAAIAASASASDAGEAAGEPATSQLMDTSASGNDVQAAAEAMHTGAGDSWQLDGGPVAELAEAAAADDMLCANSAVAADQRASAAASSDAQEMQAPAADGPTAESAEALDADKSAAARTTADDAGEQSGLLPSSPPAAGAPAADQAAPDECSTAAVELAILPAAELDTGEHTQPTVAGAAATNMLESASTASEGSAATGQGGVDPGAEELVLLDESGEPAVDAGAVEADARDVQATGQLPAEVLHDLPVPAALPRLCRTEAPMHWQPPTRLPVTAPPAAGPRASMGRRALPQMQRKPPTRS